MLAFQQVGAGGDTGEGNLAMTDIGVVSLAELATRIAGKRRSYPSMLYDLNF